MPKVNLNAIRTGNRTADKAISRAQNIISNPAAAAPILSGAVQDVIDTISTGQIPTPAILTKLPVNPNLKSKLAPLHENQKVPSSFLFPNDLDEDHYMLFKVMEQRRLRKEDTTAIKTKQTIALPIPGNLQVSYSSDYENASLGMLGAVTSGSLGASDVIGGLGSALNDVMNFGADVVSDAKEGKISDGAAGLAAAGVGTAVAVKFAGAVATGILGGDVLGGTVKGVSKSAGISMKKIEESYKVGGDLGVTAANILKQKTQTTFSAENITLERVYDTLFKIAKLEGKGSQDMKIKYISSLLNDATTNESKFILKILLGTLRLGIAENTLMDALAIAFTDEKSNRVLIENAYNVSSDLGYVSEVVATQGINGIKKFEITMFSPVRPMLADRVKSEEDAIKKFQGEFAAEYKLDGERAQIHKKGNEIIIFSRSLEKITQYYPDIIEKIPNLLICDECILEAEIVAMNEDTGNFLPFQELMHRRRKYKLEKAVSDYPITVNFFDILFLNGKKIIDLPYIERRNNLLKIVKDDKFVKVIPMSIIKNEGDVLEILENSINSGCEGLMLKMLQSPYRAGMRGSNWLKLKREYQNELGDSLDLIVIGAFFGKGRRTGRYGTLLLASYNSENDTFPSICKVGTGFTDESLDQLYQILSPNVTIKKNSKIESDMNADVWFEPSLVIEIVASEITLSPIHKTGFNILRKESGLALRFPKFTGKIRSEKNVEDASTDEEVIALYKSQKKSI